MDVDSLVECPLYVMPTVYHEGRSEGNLEEYMTKYTDESLLTWGSINQKS